MSDRYRTTDLDENYREEEYTPDYTENYRKFWKVIFEIKKAVKNTNNFDIFCKPNEVTQFRKQENAGNQITMTDTAMIIQKK